MRGIGVSLALALVVTLPGVAPGSAQDSSVAGWKARDSWPQWRGARRDGAVSGHVSPGSWLAEPELLWERDVGAGYSGPVVAASRVWIHARQGDHEVVSCLTLAEGEAVWSDRYAVDFDQDPTARAHGKGPYSTPSLADGRLFTLGVTGVLTVRDAATGDVLWRTDYSGEGFPDFPFFGTAASPLVWNDLCFVHFGGTTGRTLGAPGRGAMVALRVTDGKEQWRWTGDGPAMAASPVLGRIGEQWHLVFKTQERIVGVDPRTGRELWRHPYEVSEDNTIVTPLILGDRLVTSDYQKGTTAWRLHSEHGAWTLRQLWHDATVSLSLSSPVIIGDQIVSYSHNRKGHLVGLDLADGDVLWRGESRWGSYVHVSLVNWHGDLLALRDNGVLIVAEVSRSGLRTLHSHHLGQDKTWAHPAVVDDRIFVRDGARLAVYRLRRGE